MSILDGNAFRPTRPCSAAPGWPAPPYFCRSSAGPRAGGQTAWLDPSYPEILGLIGYTYLAVAFLYLFTRRWRWAPALWFVLLVTLCAFSTARLVAFPVRLPLYFWPFGNGALACIMMAGVVTSILFLGTGQRPSPLFSISVAAGFALLTLLAGAVLTPLGISKIRATPTWSLYSVGAAILLFIPFYWLCDLKRWTAWTFPFRSAGSNTLLTYLLPDLWYFLLVSARDHLARLPLERRSAGRDQVAGVHRPHPRALGAADQVQDSAAAIGLVE